MESRALEISMVISVRMRFFSDFGSPKIDGLEDDFPFQTGDFQVSFFKQVNHGERFFHAAPLINFS